MDERAMHQWFCMISEADRADIVAGIPGCREFGAIKMLQRMPEAAKQAARDAYARHLKLCADLEAAYPEDEIPTCEACGCTDGTCQHAA